MSPGEPERTQRFDALFATYGSDIVAFCGWRAGSASDAQDAAAEVFLTAWRRLDHVPEGDAARVWLYATARGVLHNQLVGHELLAAAVVPRDAARDGLTSRSSP